jgi:hypothetical protein
MIQKAVTERRCNVDRGGLGWGVGTLRKWFVLEGM